MMRDTMLALHFIGLAMGLGNGFAHAFLGPTISKLGKAEGQKFTQQLKALSTMGTIGTFLLLVSGVYLVIPYWPVLTSYPLLILKLVLFIILVVLILLVNLQAKNNLKNGKQDNLKRMEL